MEEFDAHKSQRHPKPYFRTHFFRTKVFAPIFLLKWKKKFRVRRNRNQTYFSFRLTKIEQSIRIFLTNLPLNISSLIRCCSRDDPRIAKARSKQGCHDEDEQQPAHRRNGWCHMNSKVWTTEKAREAVKNSDFKYTIITASTCHRLHCIENNFETWKKTGYDYNKIPWKTRCLCVWLFYYN